MADLEQLCTFVNQQAFEPAQLRGGQEMEVAGIILKWILEDQTRCVFIAFGIIFSGLVLRFFGGGKGEDK